MDEYVKPQLAEAFEMFCIDGATLNRMNEKIESLIFDSPQKKLSLKQFKDHLHELFGVISTEIMNTQYIIQLGNTLEVKAQALDIKIIATNGLVSSHGLVSSNGLISSNGFVSSNDLVSSKD